MTKVTNVRSGGASPAPTTGEAAPQKAAASIGIKTVTDDDGRAYHLRKLKPSERFALSEVVEAATMSSGMQLITAATVVGIDDEGLTPIKTRAELLARLDEIGDQGLATIMPAVLEMYGAQITEKDLVNAKK